MTSEGDGINIIFDPSRIKGINNNEDNQIPRISDEYDSIADKKADIINSSEYNSTYDDMDSTNISGFIKSIPGPITIVLPLVGIFLFAGSVLTGEISSGFKNNFSM